MQPEGTTIQIRDARPDELDEVSGVILAAYEQYAAQVPAQRWEAYARDMVDVRSRLPYSDLIVAELDGKIVGTVTFFSDGARAESEGGWPPGWAGIRLLAVRPEARGLGIGKALTQECVRRARERGLKAVGLHTTELMAVARDMYERMGFVRVPEFDWHVGRDLVVMAYRLDL